MNTTFERNANSSDECILIAFGEENVSYLKNCSIEGKFIKI